jgi:saccharopine dehydrogenase-like NADP-dependent oxidoreductase
MKKVLVLGAGMVSRPMVDYLLNHSFHVTLGDVDVTKAENNLNNHPNGKAIAINADNEAEINGYVAEADLVVSLLPYAYHPVILKHCIANRKNMVTTSYMKPVMKEMEPQLKEAGIIMLNEVGVDPGIDHISAMRLIDKIHSEGGKLIDFYSFCGALPAPEAINNPFKYRFSWSPRGVLLASKNAASYRQANNDIDVDAKDIFKDIRMIDFNDVGELEVYPNRNSLDYESLYNIEEAETIMRGTIRFPGWSEILDNMKKLDLFSEDVLDIKDKTYAQLMAERIHEKDTKDIATKTAAFLGLEKNSNVIEALRYAGYFGEETVNENTSTYFDISADLMINKMILHPSEKDMILMMHCLKYRDKSGAIHYVKSTLKEFGDGRDTAVARTVALPAAIAVRMILEEKINLSGVFIPNIPEIYNPIMNELETMGIKMHEEFGLKSIGIKSC